MEGVLSIKQIEALAREFPSARAVRLIRLGRDRSMDQPIPLLSLAVCDVDDADQAWRILSGDGTIQPVAGQLDSPGEDVADAEADRG